MSQNLFCSDVELGKFLSSLDIVPDAYRAISQTNSTYQLHTSPSGIQILAFHSSSDYTTRFLNGELDLVSSKNLQMVGFNPSFSINKAAVELFEHLPDTDDLKELEEKHVNIPLVITGCGLGGYLAILSALRLQQAVDLAESNGSKGTKRPICITFGCPLVGDEALQSAISKLPQWKSCFLNVVAKKDPVASFFSSESLYKPLGTFLFFTDAGGHTAFEDQDSILAVLDAMKLSRARNGEMYDYGNILSLRRKKVLYRGVSELGGFDFNQLRAGIMLQFQEIGVLENISSNLIEKMEDKQVKMIKRKKNAYEPTVKLNDVKISLTYMEWYMKSTIPEGGYYDCYKNAESKSERERKQEILRHQRILNKYWKETVEDKNRMPQEEGAKLLKRWLYAGTNYRRIVEPLDIAEHYRNGKTNYIENRSDHYNLLENWLNEDKKASGSSEDKKGSSSSEGKRNKAVSLTEDSCFWAHVEEALILVNELRINEGSSNNVADIEKRLEQFEVYLMSAIKDYSVSPDIFLKGSSLMKWWNEYKGFKGNSYASDFAEYMNKESYKSYQ